jgi:3-deoxy-D-manno-octulosonate 8-phosphate phosphatase (KDO 8-P phosphatase)
VKKILEKYSKEQVKKARLIKAIFVDVDGVLTDSKIIYDATGKEIKNFHVKDGQIVSHLKKAGIVIGAISGRDSVVTANRAAELKFDFCHQGIVDKAEVVAKLSKHYKLKSKEIAYIGDDIIDLGVFNSVGLAMCPKDAFDYIKDSVDLVSVYKGGEGVLRELGDLVLAARGEFEKLLKAR